MLNKQMRVPYLANVILVADADGTLQPAELETIRTIGERVQADENDILQAARSVGQGNHRLTPVGRFSDKVRNLEDMMLIALIDDELTGPEKQEIVTFAKAIHINADQIKTIAAETRCKISLGKACSACPGCGEILTPDSKFCGACGCKLAI